MIEMLKKRREDGEEGFTLIELMVVVLIIGILLAIAVPTFLSAQKNAKNKAATSNLRQALSAGKTVYADLQTYDSGAVAPSTPFTKDELKKAEPSLGWLDEGVASTSPEQISWNSIDADTVAYAVMSKPGDCFYIVDDTSDTAGGTKYARADKAASCAATDAPPAAAASPFSSGLKTSPSEAKW